MDNETNFVSAEFAEFTRWNGIRHVTSAPAHFSFNGMTKRAVKMFKEGISRMQSGSILDCLSHYLFAYRNTPHSTTGATPAQLLIERQLRSPLDLVKPDLKGRVVNEQLKQKRRHDDHACVREFDVENLTRILVKVINGYLTLSQPGQVSCCIRWRLKVLV